ncbi:hypothetical protein N9R79_07625 [Vibrio sp.]|nr:hypothetical protein [Vibrio sp.]
MQDNHNIQLTDRNAIQELAEIDDVIIIEEKDKQSHKALVASSVMALCLGVGIGALWQSVKWDTAYQALEGQYEQKIQQLAQIDGQYQQKMNSDRQAYQQQITEVSAQSQKEKNSAVLLMEQQLYHYEKKVDTLTGTVIQQEKQLRAVLKDKDRMETRLASHSVFLEEAKSLFKREEQVKSDLIALQKERDSIVPKVAELKEQCNEFLAGNSWTDQSQKCHEQDRLVNLMSRNDQMIEVYQLDLQQIKDITASLQY